MPVWRRCVRAPARRDPNAEIVCPFDGQMFDSVPGYISGYGCPCCCGTRVHLSLTRKEFALADPSTLDFLDLGEDPATVDELFDYLLEKNQVEIKQEEG